MPDLGQQLATYIDAIAEPVTPEEAMRPAPRQPRQPRRRALAAALAGAAIVLVPALVLVGLRLVPAEDPDAVAPATTEPMVDTPVPTAPPDTTPEVTVPSITAPPLPVAVPDVIGLSRAEAEAVLEDAEFVLTVTGEDLEGAVVIAQDPLAGELHGPNGIVEVMLGAAWSCADGPAPAQGAAPGDDWLPFTVWFQCGTESDAPDVSYPVVRYVSPEWEPMSSTLHMLLAGPTEYERRAGLQSFFSASTANALVSMTVTDGLAAVDFNETIYVDNASTSTGSTFFLAELNANLFQFDEIEQIEYRVNGRCEAFWNWLQRDCAVVTRTGASTASPFGVCSAAGATVPLPDPAFPLTDAALARRDLLASLAARCDLSELDRLAAADDTVLVWSHVALGDEPFWAAENGPISEDAWQIALELVTTLERDVAVYPDDDGTDVFVWPAVASPEFDWSEVGATELDALVERFGEETVMMSVEGRFWAGFRVEIDEHGRWRSFSRPLT